MTPRCSELKALAISALATVVIAIIPALGTAQTSPCGSPPTAQLPICQVWKCTLERIWEPAPALNGTACSDGDPCTYGDACNGNGGCVGTRITCTPAGPCQTSVCNG